MIPNMVFRAMQRDLDGCPACGAGECMLGARVPIDIRPDSSGNVGPGKGGLSVTPADPARLPPHFRPVALGGFGRLPVFAMTPRDLEQRLRYEFDRRKPDRHGYFEPAWPMALGDYQAALASTRPAWKEIA